MSGKGDDMLKRRRTNGFTLIELVIVIAILGILAGIAIMYFLDAQTEARRNTCLANRTELSHELAYQEAQGVDPATYFAQVYSTAANAVNRFHCPSGGTYTLNATTLEVSCSDEDHSVSSIGAVASTNGVDISKLKISSWDAVVAAAKGTSHGADLTFGAVYTDRTGTYFVYGGGSNLKQNIAETTPTLAAAAAAGVDVAKINLDEYLTAADQVKKGSSKKWTTIPTRGTVYYNGTDYYVFRLKNGSDSTGVNVETSPQWLKISK